MTKSYTQESDLEESILKSKAQQVRLYAYLNSAVLTQTAKEDVDEEAKKVKDILNEAQKYNDSAAFTSKQIDVIQARMKAKKIDSTNFKGYVILYKILGSDKRNMEVKRDSIVTYLSPIFRIIPINSL